MPNLYSLAEQNLVPHLRDGCGQIYLLGAREFARGIGHANQCGFDQVSANRNVWQAQRYIAHRYLQSSQFESNFRDALTSQACKDGRRNFRQCFQKTKIR